MGFLCVLIRSSTLWLLPSLFGSNSIKWRTRVPMHSYQERPIHTSHHDIRACPCIHMWLAGSSGRTSNCAGKLCRAPTDMCHACISMLSCEINPIRMRSTVCCCSDALAPFVALGHTARPSGSMPCSARYVF